MKILQQITTMHAASHSHAWSVSVTPLQLE